MTTHYDVIGRTYASRRSTDPRIAAPLWDALGRAGTVLNVGAGTGSYEPLDRSMIAVEPSRVMLAQRQSSAALLVQGRAETLPFRDSCVDAVMAVLTVHHWSDPCRGLEECARVARHRVVVLTWDPDADGFWLVQEYFPNLLAVDRRLFPSIRLIQSGLRVASIQPIPIPADCTDGFLGAFWQRPAAYLDAQVRAGMSSFSRIANVDLGLQRLARDLDSGEWQRRNGALFNQQSLDIGYRLVVCDAS